MIRWHFALSSLSTGYKRDEAAFSRLVEEQSTSFKPLGEKVYSYKRASPSAKGKGKGVALPENLDPDGENTIEYEVYRVRLFALCQNVN
jgi:histone acetyltransferase 1